MCSRNLPEWHCRGGGRPILRAPGGHASLGINRFACLGDPQWGEEVQFFGTVLKPLEITWKGSWRFGIKIWIQTGTLSRFLLDLTGSYGSPYRSSSRKQTEVSSSGPATRAKPTLGTPRYYSAPMRSDPATAWIMTSETDRAAWCCGAALDNPSVDFCVHTGCRVNVKHWWLWRRCREHHYTPDETAASRNERHMFICVRWWCHKQPCSHSNQYRYLHTAWR